MAHCCNIKPRSNGKAADCRVLGRRFDPWSGEYGGGGADDSPPKLKIHRASFCLPK